MKTPLLLLALALPAATLAAGPSAPLVQDDVPTMQEAGALLQAGDPMGAAKAYRAICAAQPDNAQAHHMLGYCLHMAGELEAALQAHLAASEFPAVRPVALYNCACVHALLGRTDAAFEFLTKSVEAGFNNADQLVVDTDMDSLRGDARFAKLLAEMRGEDGDEAVDLSAMAAARRMDFWLGNWDTVRGDEVYGGAMVTRTFGGRGLQQVATAPDGTTRSRSHYTFLAATGTWRQLWMDGDGSYAVLEGGLVGDAMVLTMVSVDGVPQVTGRSVFSNITAAGFDYEWQTSSDGGQTWAAGTTVRFRKRAS